MKCLFLIYRYIGNVFLSKLDEGSDVGGGGGSAFPDEDGGDFDFGLDGDEGRIGVIVVEFEAEEDGEVA